MNQVHRRRATGRSGGVISQPLTISLPAIRSNTDLADCHPGEAVKRQRLDQRGLYPLLRKRLLRAFAAPSNAIQPRRIAGAPQSKKTARRQAVFDVIQLSGLVQSPLPRKAAEQSARPAPGMAGALLRHP